MPPHSLFIVKAFKHRDAMLKAINLLAVSIKSLGTDIHVLVECIYGAIELGNACVEFNYWR